MTIKTFEPPKAYDKKNKDVILSTKHTIVEPKLDGVRALIHCTPTGVFIFSRRKNKDGEYNQFQDNIPHIRDHPWLISLGKAGYTVLDSELLAPTDDNTLGNTMTIVGSLPPRALQMQKEIGKAYVMLFDVISHKGTSYEKSTWRARRKILETIPTDTYIRRIPYTEVTDTDKKRTQILSYMEHGYEGAVLKNPEATYFESQAWLKHKEKTTIDAQVIGWIPGKGKYLNSVGSLKVAITDKETKELRFLCTVAPGTDEKRNQLYTELMPLTIEQITNLKMIVEIEGQQITKDKSMRHPRILKYREDLSKPNTL